MIALLAFLIAVEAPDPPYGSSARLAFNCNLQDVTREVTTGRSPTNQISVLMTLNRGSGTVLDTYDPSAVMSGVAFSKVSLSPYPNKEEGHFFLLATRSTAHGRPIFLVRENREPDRTIKKWEFIGILGVGRATHLGKCEILDGQRAIDLFRNLRSEKASQE